jgi:very-short-patch-repair endonuclease
MLRLLHTDGQQPHHWPSVGCHALPAPARAVRNKKAQLWRCENGHEWRASLAHLKRRTHCPKCGPANTSQAEQFLFRHIQQLFYSAQNRADVCFRGKHIELDVFVPERKFAIAYDGHHHLTRAQKDEEQNYLLTKLGIQLIRVRIPELPKLQHTQVVVLTHNPHERNSLHKCLYAIGEYIQCHFPLTVVQLQTIDTWRAITEIVSETRQDECHQSTF